MKLSIRQGHGDINDGKAEQPRLQGFAGHWIDGEMGAYLTREGEAVDHLTYILDGSAEIISSGKPIAVCGAHSYIGELTAISGEPATASVRLLVPSRYFCIGVRLLREKLLRDAEIRANLELSVSREMLHKLKRSNQALAAIRAVGEEPGGPHGIWRRTGHKTRVSAMRGPAEPRHKSVHAGAYSSV